MKPRMVWVIRDRRDTEDLIYKDVIEGRIVSIYFSHDAAVADAYTTERIWKVSVSLEVEK